MYWNEIKRIASAAGFIVGLITLGVNLLRGHTLLHSAYTALLIMIAASILFLFCLRGIGNILTTFLLEKKKEADREKKIKAKELAKEKLAELKRRRENIENKTRQRIKDQADKINAENQQEQIDIEHESSEEKMTA